ncbi:hypothetical protein SAMCCGM7_Ch3419 [Sinorhizobium americanum CCGM7]|uniref:hypothetical protein n=1 Tax=Sinorhizobium americanum TaxID=194963 RepID=UPI0004D3F84D|nr:hypothetical protein [Sinorhizobium americanum]APG86135.1 hypothetical protein SAMCCGM7_Ch3419 [Sinorhizobium americanum CCGM7]
MKLTSSLATAIFLVMYPMSQAQADDDLSTSVDVLAMNVATIRVISENCRLDIDPMLEGRVFEALAAVPEIQMSDLVSLFLQRHRNEVHARGRKCYPGDVDHLKSLTNIYQMSIANLKELVAAR